MATTYMLDFETCEKLKESRHTLERLTEDIKDVKEHVKNEQERLVAEDLDTLNSINDIVNNLVLLESKMSNLIRMNSNLIDVMDLDIGTKFKVINGMWYGEVVSIDGKKYVKHAHGSFEINEKNCEGLKVEVLKK